jgi:hypothetical protein
MRQRLPELLLPPLAAVSGTAVVLLSSGSPVRLAAGVALVLLLPGAALARAVLPHRERAAELVVVALAASIIVVMLAALGLDVMGVPLEPAAWGSVLVIITAVGSAVRVLREVRPEPGAFRLPRPRPADALMIGASLALLAGAVVLGTMPLKAPPGTPGSTALWIEPDGTRGATAVARSGKLQTARYKMSVTVDGRTVATSPSFRLAPGEQYRLPIPPPLPLDARVRARLYRLGQGGSGLPRRAELTLGGSGPLASTVVPP